MTSGSTAGLAAIFLCTSTFLLNSPVVYARSICLEQQPTQGCTVNGLSNQLCQGTSGNDEIIGTSGPDIILAGSGADVVHGNGGDDLICGGPGDDQLFGDTGNDEISGGEDADVLSGGEGNDLLLGDTGEDEIRGGKGTDRLFGGEENDTLFGDTGPDDLSGGKGDDTLLGGDDNDTLNGNSGNDILKGGKGNDILKGTSGDDQLDGNSGDDNLDGGSGTDSLTGGSGLDVCTGAEEVDGCESDGLLPEEPPIDPSVAEFTIFGHPRDPLLLRAVAEDGRIIEYFGTRDVTSGSIVFTAASVTSSEGEVTNVFLDEHKRPILLIGSDDISFEIQWLSEEKALLVARSPDGTEQFNTTIDVSEINFIPSIALNASKSHLKTSSITPQQFDESLFFVSEVHVSYCGEPINNAKVNMAVIPKFGGGEFEVRGEFVSPGKYVVPILRRTIMDDQTLCEKLASGVSPACPFTDVANFTQLLCKPLLGKVKFFDACKVVGNAITGYCKVGNQPLPDGGTLADVLCDPDTPKEYRGVPLLPNQSVTLHPDVLVPGFDRIFSPARVVFEKEPLPIFTVDVPVDEPRVLTFTTAPVDPAPSQNYTATVDFCAPSGQSIFLFVDGTDGYMDATPPCQSDGTLDSCRLVVPGAAEGVRDTLTATTGDKILKEIELEF